VPYVAGYGAFVARQPVTASRARALAGAGIRTLVLQVEWQRSRLPQRTVEQLRAEQAAARAAGLEVAWWGWCTPTLPAEAGRRPAGPRALQQRLGELIAELGAPHIFLADCEVGGRWTAKRLPELPDVAAAVRAAGVPCVGLSSHGRIGSAWDIDAFDLGSPQLYDNDSPIDVGFVRRCLATWDRCPWLWLTLGCADEASTAAQMRGDLLTVGDLGVEPRPGALWWTARQLRGDRLAAAVP